jgi:tetratricopeptide (TPR) repeat protein
MAEFQQYLRILDSDPTDTQALTALEQALSASAGGVDAAGDTVDRATLARARKSLYERGAIDTAARLLDLEIDIATDAGARADLLVERGQLHVSDLLDDQAAEACFREALALRPGDEAAQEALDQLEMERDNWRKFVQKNLDEADVSTDRALTTHMYLSVAEFYGRYQAGAPELETYLRKALAVDPENRKAAMLLGRLLRRAERWDDLLAFLDERAELVGKSERVQALLDVAEVAKEKLGRIEVAENSMKKVLAIDPAHPRALRLLSDLYQQTEAWSALVMLYTSALKTRRDRNDDAELGMLLQIGMLHWRRLGNLDAAEEYFRRIRKVQPAHPAALEFYRAYHLARGEAADLVNVLRQVQKSLPAAEHDRRREIAVEIAELSENQLGNPEKAIDAWKAIARGEAGTDSARDARAALRRLYRKTEKWNALLDLMKEEVERAAKDDVAGRVAGLMEIVEIYRDRLKLDVMVINTYKSILELDPHNRQALDDLAAKYAELGRWNDLITVLSRKAEAPEVPVAERAAILREVAKLWSDRFGNFAQAIRPLEALIDLVPDDADAFAQLKDIYSRRRQWRQLVELLGREALVLAPEQRRDKLAEMARLATERVGDSKLSIDLWNRVLELPAQTSQTSGTADSGDAGGAGRVDDVEALNALAHLYDRDKRYPALVEIYRRQRAVAPSELEAVGVLEKLGALLGDRMQAPALAAEVFQELLQLRPGHSRALRTLREIYAAEGNYHALERLYADLGQWSDLVDAFQTIADRIDDPATRLYLLERSAAIAAEHFDKPDRIARAYERLLTVAPEHLDAARALVPIYQATEKWARLLSTYEILLAHAGGAGEKLDLHLKIRDLCEDKLNSKSMAFQWTARAYQLDPARADLRADLGRLGAEADQWSEVAQILDARVRTPGVSEDERLEILRELGRIAADRLHEPERARGYQRQVLALVSDDPDAMDALEELAIELSDWVDVLAVQRRRVQLAELDSEKVDLLFKIAFIEEERLAALDDAVGTFQSILALDPDSQRAMRALARLQEARGDWAGLVDALGRELAHTQDLDTKLGLLMRIGGLYERNLDRPSAALGAYCEALALAPVRGQIHTALERFLAPVPATTPASAPDQDGAGHQASQEIGQEMGGEAGQEMGGEAGQEMGQEAGREMDREAGQEMGQEAGQETGHLAGDDGDAAMSAPAALAAPAPVGPRIAPEERIRVAELLLPVYEQSGDAARISRAVEVLRSGAGDDEQVLAYDRRLRGLYGERLGDAERAYAAGVRVLRRAPEDDANRAALLGYAATLGRYADLAAHLESVLADAPGYRRPDDPVARRALAVELAAIYDERLADTARAERTWLTVLDLPARAGDTNARAYNALERIYRTAGRWQDLRDLLLRREDSTLDQNARKDIVLAVCELEEGVLQNPPGAITAYLRALDIDPGLARAYRALERLLEQAGRHAELEELHAREIDYTDDDARVELTYRRAELRAHRLDDRHGAVSLLEEVVGQKPSHRGARTLLESLLPEPELRLQIARILEPLYEQDRRWMELTRVLRVQCEFAASAYEKAELLGRVAAVEEDEMGRPTDAFDTWVEILDIAPADPGARAALRRLGTAQNRWDDVAAAYEKAVEHLDAGDVALGAELLGELAAIYDERFEGNQRAMSAYRRLLDLDPTNPETVRRASIALERLYQVEERWRDLIEILRRQADWAEDVGERKRLLARVARVSEEELEDIEAAIQTWREVLIEDPEAAEALNALERLFLSESRAGELVEILRRRVELAQDDATRKLNLGRIAVLQEHALDDATEAIAAYLEILDSLPEDSDTLIELTRLYREQERYPDLLDILERRLALSATDSERITLTCDIATLLEKHLGREAEALDRHAWVLQRDLGHAQALEAVERLAGDPDLLQRGAEILQPIYETSATWDKLAGLLLRLADASLDPRDQLRALREVAQLREQYLDDAAGAFEVAVRALRTGLAEPELGELVSEVERLASELGRPGELIDIYQEIAPDVLDADLQRRLYLDIADLARAARKDLALARSFYQRVLDDQPEDRRALSALEGIYRQTKQSEALYEILLRKSELAAGDLDAQSAALAEAARLCAGELDRPEDAIAAWEQVLEFTPENREAVDALERLYEAAERHHDLVDLLERRLGYAFTVEEAVGLRYRLGELLEHKLYDPESAVENYSAALGGDPSHSRATEALERFLDDPGLRNTAAVVLEPIYVTHQDWFKLVRIYEIKLEGAEDGEERLALTRYIARLHEDQLEDLEGAMRWCGRVFRETPGDVDVREQLARLAAILDRWEELAGVFQAYLDDESGEPPELASVARMLGDIYNDRLADVERGQIAYRRVLQVRPDDLDTFERLEDMLRRAERWTTLIEVYEEAIAQAPLDQAGDRRRIELQLRMAWTYEHHLHDVEQAVSAYRAVRDIDPDQPTAVAELDRLYQAQGSWFELGELLGQRIARADERGDVATAVELRMRLAEVLARRLDDVASAIDQYELVLQAPTGWQKALPPLERLVIDEEHRARIAELLEPIYRANDWWQKLVVILDTQVGYVDDPERRVAMLREIAHIHETRGGDKKMALEALSRAWRENVRDQDALSELTALAAKLGAWDALVATLTAGLQNEYDPELVAAIWARIAEIHEERRKDAGRAIDAWRKVLEVKDDDEAALGALDRLLVMEERYGELVSVVEKRALLADDEGARLVLLRRVASLYEDDLGQASEAIQAYRNVLNVDDADALALDALERLYRQERDWNELANTLARKIELSQDRGQRRALRFAAAEIYDRELRDAYEAMASLRAVLDPETGDPSDAEALARLDALYQREAMWPELVEIIDRRVALEGEPAARAELSFRAAQVVEKELVEPEQAIERYARVLGFAPGHGRTRAALDALAQKEETADRATAVLESLYQGGQDAASLAALYERRLSMPAPDPDARKAQYQALARVYEESQGDLDRAFEVWARALVEFQSDEDVQDQLERLAALRGAWDELVSLLEERLGELYDPALEYAYAVKLASLYEDALGDLDGAAAKYRRALDAASDEREPLAALDRIYGRAGRFPELAEILAREADATIDEAEKCQYLFRLGDLRETALRDLPGAVAAYREVLERASNHGAARAALERLLGAEIVRAEIIRILEPLYEQEGDHGRLTDLLTAKLGTTPEHFERARIYSRIAELAEQQLGDPVRALDAAGGWLAEDPRSEQALAELGRLGARVNRFGEVAARLSGIIDSADDPEVQRVLLLQLGSILLDRLGDAGPAEAAFLRALEIDPESVDALDALQRIYRARNAEGDRARLADMLGRLAQLTYEPEAKRRYHVEVAELRASLGELDAAVSAWQEVLKLDEGDRDALAQLTIIHEQRADWRALIDVLGQSARYAAHAEEERRFRTRIALIQSDTLQDLDAAVEAWQAVLDVAPDASDALAALEAIHARREDWVAVQDTLLKRLDLVDDRAGRVEVLRRLASLAAEKRGAVDDAIGYLLQALDVDDAHVPTYEDLDRLLGQAQRWHDLVELLERAAGVYARLAAGGDGAARRKEIDCLARAADIWEGPLANPDAAAEILEKILARQPNYVPALTRLSKIYEAAGDWDRCRQVLERALALGPTGRDAAELYFRMGEVARAQGGGDPAMAMHRWQQALGAEPGFLPAIEAIETAARAAGDWPLVADMLARREAQTREPAARLAMLLELAELYRKKLGQPAQAIPLLERAAQGASDDERVLGPLADLYFAAAQYDRAVPIYERLAENAKKARQMKQVATYRQRLGGIFEARGSADEALAAYEEAFRVNPTDVATMAGLGRIYMAREAWEKARRVYRSMVLQNLDDDAGVTKAQVYYYLGLIHVALGEPRKAKGMYQRGLEMEPQNAELQKALEALGPI